MFDFTIHHTQPNSGARTGTFTTPHGNLETPVFMPVGTKGIVKTLTPHELDGLGAQIMLSNTYHLALRPGAEYVEKQGGLHNWIKWQKPIITDSGGYQVFSLAKLRKITEEGAKFQSHLDGSPITLTPESATKIQEQLGADIIMAFDECIAADANKKYVKEATDRTHRWLQRCMKAHTRKDQALFPIVQGGLYDDLRLASLEFCKNTNLPGLAVGGLSVGEGKSEMYRILKLLQPHLPKDRPCYLMGVGNPDDILEAIDNGFDMFDCVQPTRLARHGNFWNESGSHCLKNSRYRSDTQPLQVNCTCYTCQTFGRDYIRHLFIEHEITALRLLTIHNLHFLLELIRTVRTHIKQGTFINFKKEFTEKFRSEKFPANPDQAT